jgi:hypothetical protein
VIAWILAVSLCFAQDGAPEAAEGGEATEEPERVEEDLEGVEEVLVYGELRVMQSRQRVEDRLEAGGYTLAAKKDDRTIYRHVAPYRGKVVIHDDGWMKVRRQGVRVEGREWGFAERNSATAWALCVVTPWRCVRVGGVMVSQRKFQGYRGTAVEGVGGDVEEWSSRIADLAIDRKLELLDQALLALWIEGIPVQGTERLDTPADRRQALLAYWASRTETVWGRRVREAVAAFIRGEVQYSDHPFTEAEITAFNGERTGDTPFPWTRVETEKTPPDGAVVVP